VIFDVDVDVRTLASGHDQQIDQLLGCEAAGLHPDSIRTVAKLMVWLPPVLRVSMSLM